MSIQQSSATPQNKDVGRECGRLLDTHTPTSQGLFVSLFFGKVSSLRFLYLSHSFSPGPRHSSYRLALAIRDIACRYGYVYDDCASATSQVFVCIHGDWESSYLYY